MGISMFQAILLGLFACLASLPGMGGTTVGNYTLGRPLVGGLVVGLIMGDIQTGIIVGAAIQLVYIALVTRTGHPRWHRLRRRSCRHLHRHPSGHPGHPCPGPGSQL